jgi:hypothetical protein
MRAFLCLFCAISFSVSSPAQSSRTSSTVDDNHPAAWEIAAQKRRDELVQKNGPGTDLPLQKQLLRMRDEDQAARGFMSGRRTSTMTKEMLAKLPATDQRLTQELEHIVHEKAWPTISLVGIEASNGAMLILTHSANHAWQRSLLPTLEQLAEADKIDASSLALVVDKQLIADGKLQRYGSQFKFINGKMAMYAVEDPSHLDERRAKALLPPLDVYKQILGQIYQLQATDDVVMAIPEKK